MKGECLPTESWEVRNSNKNNNLKTSVSFLKDRFRFLIQSAPHHPSAERLITSGSRRSVIGLVNVLQGFESWKGRKILLFSISPDQLCSSPSLLLSRYRYPFPVIKAASMWLTAYLVPRWRMSRAVPPLPVYAFTAGTATTLLLPLLALRIALCNLFLVTKLAEPVSCWVVFVVSYVG